MYVFDNVIVEEAIAGSSPIVKALFNIAYKLKKREYLAGRRTSLWDKIVFKKMAARFGGRLRFMVTTNYPTHDYDPIDT
jgi:long-subunit acyl-CoA synthetase (AMP-forming)